MPTGYETHTDGANCNAAGTTSPLVSRSTNSCPRRSGHRVARRGQPLPPAILAADVGFVELLLPLPCPSTVKRSLWRVPVDELIKTIQEKTGLPVDKAQDVIETVVGFIADKLPGPIGDQVKNFLGDEGGGGGDAGGGEGLMDKAKDALGGLGGLLGGDK